MIKHTFRQTYTHTIATTNIFFIKELGLGKQIETTTELHTPCKTYKKQQT